MTPDFIKNHPVNLQTIDRGIHRRLHQGGLGLLDYIRNAIPPWAGAGAGFGLGDTAGNTVLGGLCGCSD
jgi:hypothetical protein